MKPGHNQENETDADQHDGADRRTDDGKKSAETAPDGGADIKGPAADVLEGAIDHRRLGYAENDDPDESKDEAADDHRGE